MEFVYQYEIEESQSSLPCELHQRLNQWGSIHSGISELHYDFFALVGTSSDTKRVEINSCLTSSEYKIFYQYYSFSPCVYTNSLSTNEVSTSSSSSKHCTKDYLTYASINIPTAQRVQSIVGIAGDSHMIFGSYKATSVLCQPCDVYACNGVTVNGKCVYVSTLFSSFSCCQLKPQQKCLDGLQLKRRCLDKPHQFMSLELGSLRQGSHHQ